MIIDTTPPKVRILTGQHNIERGGSALIIYQVFEPDVKTGVMVGDNFFPGHSGMFDDPQIKAAFFALDHTQGPGTRMAVTAQDLAGNVTERGFHHYIRDKNFRSDTLNISQGFLEQKMPDFHLGGEMESKFESQADPLVEKFIYVNDQLRRQNSARVLSATSDTVGQLLWQGRFSRLPGAAKRAGFADHRVYKHSGKEISQATHLGVDLASTSHAPVGAANTGRVILAHDEGIYGKVVIIDHGFGLASLYSHLSEIHVNVGDEVKKGDVLGKTGITGMAGGDHLHFSMIVHNVFVNPLEWWDPNWIKNNVTSKIEFVKKDNT